MAKQRTNSSAATEADAAAVRLKPTRTRKSVPRRESPSRRTSAYRGVTRHRWTGRFEAHLWDKNTWSESQRKKKGRQVYLGAYGGEEAAARAYDLAALKYWGRDTVLNFPLSNYDEEWKEMEGQSREEYIGSLRRKSTGFSRGVSKYRGVARHHHNGKWEARIGRVYGNKYLYLGTYATQEEAAMAYDIAAIEHRGLNAVTNFDVSRYINWHRRLCRAGAGDDNEIPDQQPLSDLIAPPMANTASLHDDDEDDQFLLPSQVTTPPSTSSALGLLLQSPRFKEVIEGGAATMASSESSTTGSPPSWSSCSPSPPSPSPSPPPKTQQQQQQQQQAQPEYASSSARCSFPDDVQTYFGCGEDGYGDAGVGCAEVDTFLFGDLSAYAAPMFHFELDV